MSSAVACSVATHSPCNVAYPNIWDPVLEAARAPKVLALHDIVETTTNLDLAGQGFNTTLGGSYRTYADPDFSPFDVVLWLEGRESQYGHPLAGGIDTALAAYVAGGGGLIRCGWGLWRESLNVFQGVAAVNPLCTANLPVGLRTTLGGLNVQSQNAGPSDWLTPGGASILKYGLPDTIAQPDPRGGATLLDLKTGAVAVYTLFDARMTPSGTRVPAVAYTTQYGGCTMYINDTLLYTNGTRSIASGLPATIKQVYYNAIRFAAQKAANP